MVRPWLGKPKSLGKPAPCEDLPSLDWPLRVDVLNLGSCTGSNQAVGVQKPRNSFEDFAQEAIVCGTDVMENIGFRHAPGARYSKSSWQHVESVVSNLKP